MLEQKFAINLNSFLENISLSKIAVAVSGGIDSVALLVLLSKWSKDKGIKIKVLTVDHNLRSESVEETQYVFNLSNELGHECSILNWNHENNYSNLSARARAGRYNIMTEFCIRKDILLLLVGQHQDDMLENFLIRQERKSGILGLSSSFIYYCNNVRIIRPLYDFTKYELIQYLKNLKIKWFEDSSNKDDKYLRNRIRNNLSKYQNAKKKKIIDELALINSKSEQTNATLIAAIAESTTIYQHGVAILDIIKFDYNNYEVKLKLMGLLLNTISGKNNSPKANSINLIINLLSYHTEDFSKTLHGCYIKKIGYKLFIYRSFGKTMPIDVMIHNQHWVKWDNRFSVQYQGDMQNLYITYLSKEDFAVIKQQLDIDKIKDHLHFDYKNILFTLPVLKTLEKIVALPHISYYDSHNFNDKIKVSFQPNFTSRFIHFY